jgi:hypothetical protein
MRFALLLLSLTFGLLAQTDRGTISGIVTDSAGAAVSGATVAITNAATNTTFTIRSADTGEFAAPNLTVGQYRVEVTQPGFKRFVRAQIVVAAGGSVRVDAQLQLGQVSETIEVQSSSVQVQTENVKITTAVSNKMVDELPLVVGGAMRSVFNLVTIAAESKGDGTRLTLGGGQAAAWDATLDGLSITTNRSADTGEIA